MTQTEHTLQALDRLSEILAADIEFNAAGERALLERALDLFLDILEADRVFLIFVSEQGEQASFAVPIERTHPDWPGAMASGAPPVIDDFNRQIIVDARTNLGQALCYGPGRAELPADCDIRVTWGVQTIVLTSMRPRVGPTWYVGAHYCQAPRELSFEPALLTRLARRLSDSVASMVALEELRESEARYRTLVEHAPEAIVLLDIGQRRFVDCNSNAEALFGRPMTKLLELDVTDVSPELQPGGQRSAELAEAYVAAACAGEPQTFEWEHLTADGRPLACEVRLVRVPSTKGVIVRGSITDISERKALEHHREQLAERLRQGQKLEALGRLTGGVAHDFNNLLTIISGQLELIELDHANDDELREDITVARGACARAAALTQQLLAFARRKTLLPRALQLSTEVSTCISMLRRTLGGGIEIVLELDEDIPPCRLDPNQLTNVLLNLCINARDAMGHRGRLEISTRALNLAEGERVDVDGEGIVGDYAVLHVRDEGPGIDPELLGRVFDPFVTTKGDEGTGLGLSMVYGFVKQSGGHIEVETALGSGTCFSLYFPVVEGPVEYRSSEIVEAASSGSWGGGQLLLVLEDEAAVRRLLVEMLESLGYRCVAARSADEALEHLRDHDDIAALISDMVLGGGERGVDVACEVRRLYPRLPILFVSGYSQDDRHVEMTELGAELLEKPFTRSALARKIAGILEDQVDSPEAH